MKYCILLLVVATALGGMYILVLFSNVFLKKKKLFKFLNTNSVQLKAYITQASNIFLYQIIGLDESLNYVLNYVSFGFRCVKFIVIYWMKVN